MNSLLNILGTSSPVLAIILIVLIVLVLVLLGMCVTLMVKQNRMQKKLAKFTVGKNGASLEADIIALIEETKLIKATADKNRKDVSVLFKRMEGTFQKLGLVKYDAFQQMGGKLSFSLALLDENDNGFIINSVHSTEGCYSYTKEINAGICSLTLGKEEEQALAIAMGKK